jgi:hypothetical protein
MGFLSFAYTPLQHAVKRVPIAKVIINNNNEFNSFQNYHSASNFPLKKNMREFEGLRSILLGVEPSRDSLITTLHISFKNFKNSNLNK